MREAWRFVIKYWLWRSNEGGGLFLIPLGVIRHEATVYDTMYMSERTNMKQVASFLCIA